MNIKKSAVLFGASVVCAVCFIISIISLLFGNGSLFGYSVVIGIVIGIITFFEIFKKRKDYNESENIFSFISSCLKKECGEELYKLSIALILSFLPLILAVGLIMLCIKLSGNSTKSNTSNINANASSNRTTTSNNNSSEEFKEWLKLASNSTSSFPAVDYMSWNKIQKTYFLHPEMTPEEIHENYFQNLKVETIRACRPCSEFSYNNFKSAATKNSKIKMISEIEMKNIHDNFRRYPELTDEEMLENHYKNYNIETIRACRMGVTASHQDILNRALHNSSIKAITKDQYNSIIKSYKEHPSLTAEEIYERYHKHLGIETVRACMPR